MEPQFEIRYTIDKKALREFHRKIGSGPRYPTVFAMAVVFAGLTLYSACAGILADVLHVLIGYGAASLAIFFMPWYIAWNALRGSRRNNDGVMPETRVTVGDTIEMDEGMIRISLEYRKLRRVVHLKRSYVLMLGRRNGVLIDPNGFTKGTFAEFRQFLREKRPDLEIPE